MPSLGVPLAADLTVTPYDYSGGDPNMTGMRGSMLDAKTSFGSGRVFSTDFPRSGFRTTATWRSPTCYGPPARTPPGGSVLWPTTWTGATRDAGGGAYQCARTGWPCIELVVGTDGRRHRRSRCRCG